MSIEGSLDCSISRSTEYDGVKHRCAINRNATNVLNQRGWCSVAARCQNADVLGWVVDGGSGNDDSMIIARRRQ